MWCRDFYISCVVASCAVFICIPTDCCASLCLCINVYDFVWCGDFNVGCIITFWTVCVSIPTDFRASLCFCINVYDFVWCGDFNVGCIIASCAVFVCFPADFCTGLCLSIYLYKCIFVTQCVNCNCISAELYTAYIAVNNTVVWACVCTIGSNFVFFHCCERCVCNNNTVRIITLITVSCFAIIWFTAFAILQGLICFALKFSSTSKAEIKFNRIFCINL